MARNAVFVMTLLGLGAMVVLGAVQDKTGGTTQTAAKKDGQLSIGVVNLKECFKGERYEWVKKIDAELKELADAHAAKLADLDKRMRTTTDKLRGLPKGTALYYKLLTQRKVLETELETAEKIGKLQYLDVYTEKKTKVYNEIIRVAGIIGKDRGYDLVLRVAEPFLEEDDRMAQTVSAQIRSRTVLYNSATIDITNEVIKKLNEEYKKNNPGGNGGKAPAKQFWCPSCKADRPASMVEGGRCKRCGKAVEDKK